MKLVLGLLTVITFSTNISFGFQIFLDKIPNGRNVADPCDPSTTWLGVGHQAKQGGGQRNVFGHHFQQLRTWPVLCKVDSDGDGRTNGEELGDPDCVWVEGATLASTNNITHPGICEPVDSPDCQRRNTFLNETNCSILKETPLTPVQYSFGPTIFANNLDLDKFDVHAGCSCACPKQRP